jgi:hypothetical protein
MDFEHMTCGAILLLAYVEVNVLGATSKCAVHTGLCFVVCVCVCVREWCVYFFCVEVSSWLGKDM